MALRDVVAKAIKHRDEDEEAADAAVAVFIDWLVSHADDAAQGDQPVMTALMALALKAQRGAE